MQMERNLTLIMRHCYRDKRKVDYTAITVIEIKIGREDKRQEVLQTIFANLNKSGAILSPQELRNGNIYV